MHSDFEAFNEYFRYDPERGKLYWKKRNANCTHVGKEAGWIIRNNNRTPGHHYRYVQFKGKVYKVHRIIWLLVYGQWPKDEIDHINHDSLGNRTENLREVTRLENQHNKAMYSNNKTGVTGVSWHKRIGKYRADIRVSGKTRFLGYFTSLQDAAKARRKAERKYGFHPNHGRKREPIKEAG